MRDILVSWPGGGVSIEQELAELSTVDRVVITVKLKDKDTLMALPREWVRKLEAL